MQKPEQKRKLTTKICSKLTKNKTRFRGLLWWAGKSTKQNSWAEQSLTSRSTHYKSLYNLSNQSPNWYRTLKTL